MSAMPKGDQGDDSGYTVHTSFGPKTLVPAPHERALNAMRTSGRRMVSEHTSAGGPGGRRARPETAPVPAAGEVRAPLTNALTSYRAFSKLVIY
eukprot:1195193-Prorocentrum_minimum.AAC.2